MGGSIRPMKIEGELQRRFPADRLDLDIFDMIRRSQPVEQLQQGLVVVRHARTGDIRKVLDLERLYGNHAVFWKGLGEVLEDRERARRIVEPRPKLTDV